jgi:co-chaperonin GroES (HSP10)
MHFEPFNKHIWIIPIEQEKTEAEQLIIMPEEYNPPQSPYIVGDVIGMSEDCTVDLFLGDTVVVERTTVQEIKAQDQTIYVVKENYVYGRLGNEIN